MNIEERQEIINLLTSILDNFNPRSIESYRMVIGALYNNITLFHEQDNEINELTAKILDKANILSTDVEEKQYDLEQHFIPKSIRQQFRGKKLNDKFCVTQFL